MKIKQAILQDLAVQLYPGKMPILCSQRSKKGKLLWTGGIKIKIWAWVSREENGSWEGFNALKFCFTQYNAYINIKIIILYSGNLAWTKPVVWTYHFIMLILFLRCPATSWKIAYALAAFSILEQYLGFFFTLVKCLQPKTIKRKAILTCLFFIQMQISCQRKLLHQWQGSLKPISLEEGLLGKTQYISIKLI